jgi:hypothetical protein
MDNSHLHEYVRPVISVPRIIFSLLGAGEGKLKIDDSVPFFDRYRIEFFSGADGSSGRSENVAG